MQTDGNGRRHAALAVGAIFFFLFAEKAKAVSRPSLFSPANGVERTELPVFAWNAASGADRYQFEMATDAGFNSPIRVDGHDYVTTHNTRATLKKDVPNGTLYWHVRAVSASGTPSAWSPQRSFVKRWD